MKGKLFILLAASLLLVGCGAKKEPTPTPVTPQEPTEITITEAELAAAYNAREASPYNRVQYTYNYDSGNYSMAFVEEIVDGEWTVISPSEGVSQSPRTYICTQLISVITGQQSHPDASTATCKKYSNGEYSYKLTATQGEHVASYECTFNRYFDIGDVFYKMDETVVTSITDTVLSTK